MRKEVRRGEERFSPHQHLHTRATGALASSGLTMSNEIATKTKRGQASAGGLPIGAVLVTERVAQVMKPGDHGSTFAGNPLVCNAAVAVFQKIANPEFLDAVARRGERLVEGLRKGLAGNPHVKEVRGRGLICGIQLDQVCHPCSLACCSQASKSSNGSVFSVQWTSFCLWFWEFSGGVRDCAPQEGGGFGIVISWL